jgi:hypothetical protein
VTKKGWVTVRDHNEHLRRDGYRRIVDYLADRFGLLAHLDPEDAVDRGDRRTPTSRRSYPSLTICKAG